MGNTLSIALLFLLSFQVPAQPSIPLDPNVEPPVKLSQTGIFDGDVSQLRPAKGFYEYEIIQPLFVDHAQKQRLLFLPQGTRMGFSATGAYSFPVGSVLVKHFHMEVAKDLFQNLETRVLVRKSGEDRQNWVGYTYRWNGKDADLVDAKSSPEVVLDVDASAPGGARRQTFKIPSRSQCLQCHQASVGYVRSVETRQLNRLGLDGGNQLVQLSRAGLFDRTISEPEAAALERYAEIGDESMPLEKRVRSYLAVNCAHCHNPDPKAMCSFTGLDFRFSTFSHDALVTSGHLVKGQPDRSELFLRMSSDQPGYRMPYIGAALRDEAALTALRRWITGL